MSLPTNCILIKIGFQLHAERQAYSWLRELQDEHGDEDGIIPRLQVYIYVGIKTSLVFTVVFFALSKAIKLELHWASVALSVSYIR